MSRFVYLVVGSTGEYEDRVDWNVRAFVDKKDAGQCRDALNQWCDTHHVEPGGAKAGYLSSKKKPKLDRQFRCDHNGTTYAITRVPLSGAKS